MFVSLPVPSSVADLLWGTVSEVLDSEPDAIPVARERYHLTLRFLGDLSLTAIDRLVRALEQELAGVNQFQLRIDGAGHFDEAKVAWARPAPSGELMHLEHLVTGAIERVVEECAPRIIPFLPHITLAKEVPPASPLCGLLAERCVSGAFLVPSVDVMTSRGPMGYHRLAAISLKAVDP